jgi:hypothetical protein
VRGQQKVAKNHATLAKSGRARMSDACSELDESVMARLHSWIFGPSQHCIEYYESLEIDPMWEVTPAEVCILVNNNNNNNKLNASFNV